MEVLALVGARLPVRGVGVALRDLVAPAEIKSELEKAVDAILVDFHADAHVFDSTPSQRSKPR